MSRPDPLPYWAGPLDGLPGPAHSDAGERRVLSAHPDGWYQLEILPACGGPLFGWRWHTRRVTLRTKDRSR